MQCGNLLECHSDTGFRAEPDKEGIIDGRSARGSNYRRMGTDMDGKEICNFIEAQVGMTKVAVRSTFTSETHGVIATTDGAICLALTFHEIRQGPVSHSEAMRLSDESGLSMEIAVVTDARNILAALKVLNLKIPAEKNFLVHLAWLRYKLC